MAIISGGDTVVSGDTESASRFMLSGRDSYDPDDSDGDMTFLWKCTEKGIQEL